VEVQAYVKTEGSWTLGLRKSVESGEGKGRKNGEVHTLIGLDGPLKHRRRGFLLDCKG
jgi:hypothetical protein